MLIVKPFQNHHADDFGQQTRKSKNIIGTFFLTKDNTGKYWKSGGFRLTNFSKHDKKLHFGHQKKLIF